MCISKIEGVGGTLSDASPNNLYFFSLFALFYFIQALEWYSIIAHNSSTNTYWSFELIKSDVNTSNSKFEET